MVPIGRHILKYRPLVLTSSAIGIRTMPIRTSGPGVLGHRRHRRPIEEERRMQVLVRDNNVDQALKVLKKKMQRDGLLPMKPRVFSGPPGRGGPARAPRF
jgi:pentatricopeptide repeat protein